MKQFVTPIILGLLLLVGCDEAGVLPTEIPVAQLPTTTPAIMSPTTEPTISLPTVVPEQTNTPTSTPHPPTDTATPISIDTSNTVSKPIDMLDPSLPPLTGQIYMFWDPNPPAYTDNKFAYPLTYNFYRIMPSTSPTFNMIDVAPAYIRYGTNVLNMSPDQRKMILLMYEDTNENGSIDLTGYDVDNQTVHIYDVASGTVTPFISGKYGILFTSWLPDSQALLYPQGEDVLLARLDGSSPEIIANFPDAHINHITLSPDGHMLVTDRNHNQIQAYDLDTNKIVAITDDKQVRGMGGQSQWSPDGNLLSFGQQSLFDMGKREFTVSGIVDDKVVYTPSWSPDGQWLAISSKQTRDANLTKLSLWNRDTLAVTEILTGTFISPPIWSPQDNMVTVGLINDSMGTLLAIDTNSGNVQEWHIGDDIHAIRVLSYSPDGNWIAFVAVGSDSSALYLAPIQGENIYSMLDMVGGDAMGEFVWLPDS